MKANIILNISKVIRNPQVKEATQSFIVGVTAGFFGHKVGEAAAKGKQGNNNLPVIEIHKEYKK